MEPIDLATFGVTNYDFLLMYKGKICLLGRERLGAGSVWGGFGVGMEHYG